MKVRLLLDSATFSRKKLHAYHAGRTYQARYLNSDESVGYAHPRNWVWISKNAKACPPMLIPLCWVKILPEKSIKKPKAREKKKTS